VKAARAEKTKERMQQEAATSMEDVRAEAESTLQDAQDRHDQHSTEHRAAVCEKARAAFRLTLKSEWHSQKDAIQSLAAAAEEKTSQLQESRARAVKQTHSPCQLVSSTAQRPRFAEIDWGVQAVHSSASPKVIWLDLSVFGKAVQGLALADLQSCVVLAGASGVVILLALASDAEEIEEMNRRERELMLAIDLAATVWRVFLSVEGENTSRGWVLIVSAHRTIGAAKLTSPLCARIFGAPAVATTCKVSLRLPKSLAATQSSGVRSQ